MKQLRKKVSRRKTWAMMLYYFGEKGKERTRTHRAKDECVKEKGCFRFRLGCELFPLMDSKDDLSGVCAERLDLNNKTSVGE